MLQIWEKGKLESVCRRGLSEMDPKLGAILTCWRPDDDDGDKDDGDDHGEDQGDDHEHNDDGDGDDDIRHYVSS